MGIVTAAGAEDAKEAAAPAEMYKLNCFLSLPVPLKISILRQHLQEIAIKIKCQLISRVIHIVSERDDQHGIETRNKEKDK